MATIGQKKAKAAGGTYTNKSGTTYTSSGSTSSKTTGVPAYNSATGATTGKPSAEYDSYLKSLNKKGSANYVPTPDDAGFENMDQINNAAIQKKSPSPTPLTQYQIKPGDTLGGIAQANQTTVGNLQAANPNITDPNKIYAGQQLSIGERNKQGLANIQANGVAQTDNVGEARSIIAQNTPAAGPDSSGVEAVMAADPLFQKQQKLEQEYNAAENQRVSLVDEYKKLTKAAGIEDINTDLINMKNVIDGTEDDIRNEVQAASGFATDSQVMALASARNKSLIKNYNTLLDTKNAQMENINTMMGLAEKDRSLAQQSLQNRMQFVQQEMQFRDKFISAAQEGYNSMIKLAGVDGLYNSLKNDPTALRYAEQVLKVPRGSLATAATQAMKDRAKQNQMDSLDIQAKKASIANTYNQINNRNNPVSSQGTLSGKPQNATQSAANGYADRLAQSNSIIDKIGNKFTGKLAKFPLPNILKSGERQSFEQAKKEFVTAILRRQSGASIAPSEFKTEEEKYFPQPGDKPEILLQKAASRNTAINGLYREANVFRPVFPGQIIEENGVRYRVEDDGETLTEI